MVALARHNETVPGLVRLYVILSAEATSPDHPAHDYIHDNYAQVRKGTAWALRGAQRAGLLRDDVEPERATVQLLALQEGLQRQWLDDPEAVPLAANLEAAIQSLLAVPLWAEVEAAATH